jgi:calcium-dependent protein kinase
MDEIFPFRYVLVFRLIIKDTYTSAWFSELRKDSRYTEKDAAVVVRQMLKVAAKCHLHGLVHRDMKPEV